LGGSSPTSTNGTGPSPIAKLTTNAMMPADATAKCSVLIAHPRTAVESDMAESETRRRERRPRRCRGHSWLSQPGYSLDDERTRDARR